MINICGCVCIPGAKQGMLELIPQTLFFLERARVNTEGGSGYPRLVDRRVRITEFLLYVHVSVVCQITRNHVNQTRACSKSVLGGKIRPVTPVLFIS